MGARDGGADLRAVFNDRFVLDATINPDFSQIESGEPQVTANQRFKVFFPERRPFFLENADFFHTPINLVFTRRILDPSVGTRLTGKLGRYSIGALVTNDESSARDDTSTSTPNSEVSTKASARLSVLYVGEMCARPIRTCCE